MGADNICLHTSVVAIIAACMCIFRRDLLFNIGLIDERDRDYFKKVGKMVSDAINAKRYTAAFQLFDELLNGDLSGRPSYFYNVTGFKNYFNYALTQLPASFDLYPKYVQVWHVHKI